MNRCLLVLFFCLLSVSLADGTMSALLIDPAPYKAVPLKGSPVVSFIATDANLSINITSPTGIGGLSIEKTGGQWPSGIKMRLHVKGLESFRFRYADTTVDVSVSSHGDKAVRESCEQATLDVEFKPGDPNWIAVTPGAGYFDLQAPAAFLKSGQSRFTIEWIDFYR